MPVKVNVLEDQDGIVITGMSGQYPKCKNVKEFEYNLYNKIDMVDDYETRWVHKYPGVPRNQGKIPYLSKFDATFFGVTQAQADHMDVQMRIIIEEAYKAVMDAGVNPTTLRNSNTGVYVATCASESDSFLSHCENSPHGLGLLGSSKSLLANRISFVLGLNGPSLICDTACSSSIYALDLAYQHLKNGTVDAAIVGGTNIVICPYITAKFAKLGVLSLSGKCRPFDEDANGYVRSEAISCIFLQRRANAKRIYATLVHSATNCDGYKAEGLTYPSGNMQLKLLQTFYDDIKFDVNDLGYMEAHSTATVVGDPEECRAIDQAIGKKRSSPLLIGSVKSNCGHTEGSSGIVSLTKVLLTFNNNCIPPNINFSKPRKAIEGLNEGRLAVVTERMVLNKPFICINSFGFGGANAHALFKQDTSERSVPSYGDLNELPYLFTWSSRTEANIKALFEYVGSQPLNLEHLALMRSSQFGGIKGMMYRGYSILKPSNSLQVAKPITMSMEVQHNEGVKRPIVWVLSGMGSQWAGMGKDLMKIKVCADSILKCHTALKSKGVDLINILTTDEPDTYQNILNSFVGITAIQIALIDLLQAIEMKPDFIIGHSLGEVSCGYADNCLTAEQTILASYYRGKISIELEKIHGSMAAVGLSFKDIKTILPPSIDVACHNSNDSCTISGPGEHVSDFIENLKAKNIFAKEVNCSNIAYHSRYIKHFGPELMKYLKELMPQPKPRSNRWISTSFPADKWQFNETKFCSPEYHVNNMISSVLFEENSMYLPKNSLTIELAPHALIQSILKSCNPDGIHVGLTRRNAKDNIFNLLNALGKLYIHGLELNFDKLYPSIQWPVNRGTPTISDLVEFDHTSDYAVNFYEDECVKTGNKIITISTSSEHKYLLGHEIDGRPLVPATFYLESVWKTFALMHGILDFESFDVEFENVLFLRATTLSTNAEINLQVSIQKATGAFEIMESKTLVASGFICKITEKFQPLNMSLNANKSQVHLTNKDFYKELKLRGYHYHGDFKAVQLACSDGSQGKIKWSNNWVAFMDSMLQLIILQTDSRNLALPVKLRSMRIHCSYHKQHFANNCDIEVKANNKRLVAGGIEIIDLKTRQIQRRKPASKPILESYQFVENFNGPKFAANDISKCCAQLFLENVSTTKCTIAQASFSTENEFVFLNGLVQAINDLPTVQGHYTSIDMTGHESVSLQQQKEKNIINFYRTIEEVPGNIDILLMEEENFKTNFLTLKPKMSVNSLVMVKTKKTTCLENFAKDNNYNPIAFFCCLNSPFNVAVLLRKSCEQQQPKETFIKISQVDVEFQWLQDLKAAIGKRIVLVADKEPQNGLIGLVNCLRKEPETSDVRCVFIDDAQAPDFEATLTFYSKQLELGLAINVYRQGHWGTYRHLDLKPSQAAKEHREHISGAIGNIGDFSTLHWQTGCMNANANGDDVAKIRICYSALNFRDVMHASGRLSADDIGLSRLEQSFVFGLEYSGIDESSGHAVMGMALHSAMASYLGSNSIISWHVPSHWTLQEAATVPVVYTTVYYAFFYTIDIRKGKDILIHSGSGGVGIAAIRTAIAYGLEVYATVSSVEKKKFLLQTFPQLKEENIGNSRDCSFEEMISNRTNGRGVDFILNSLSEEKLKASLRCLAPNGHFLEIGKFDMANDSLIGLGVFFQGQNFHAVLADKLVQYAPHLLQTIKSHIADDIGRGIVQPLPCTVFKPTELEHAFRYLMTGKHIGKILIEIRPNVKDMATYPVAVTPKVYFSEKLVYVVPGGLGGFGLELVDWMILRGARKIVLNSRHGLSDAYQKLRISIWQSYNCHIKINTSDITTENGCLELLKESLKLGSLGGIFNLAVSLKDGTFANQTIENFQQSLAPKAVATKYLDKLSRSLCPKLSHFVIFSSVSCGRGNAGQTNYGMANSIMERIIEERLRLGYAGKAVQWGAVGEVGLVDKLTEGKIDLNIGGTLQQRINSCIEVLDTLLTCPEPVVSSMVVAEKITYSESQTPLQFVMQTLSLTQLKSVSVKSTLAELGMDSLMGVEIKQTLERKFDIILSPAELRTLTIERLKEISEMHKEKGLECKTVPNNNNNYFINLLESLYLNLSFNSINTQIVLPVNNTDSKQEPIIIFPGIEGVYSKGWHQIGPHLKAPAYCVQLLAKFATESFHDLVKIIVNEISKILNGHRKNKFRIVAHSFGTLLAHIVIKHLENMGFSGSAVYIDGSPIWVENICKEINLTSDSLEVKKRILLLTLKSLVQEEQMENFTRIVEENQNMEVIYWNIKQNLNLKDVDERVIFLKAAMATADTVLNINTYKLVDIIESKILIIRPSTLVHPNFDEFYGLKPVTRNVIDVAQLEGDHHSILLNKQVPEILNNYFSIK